MPNGTTTAVQKRALSSNRLWASNWKWFAATHFTAVSGTYYRKHSSGRAREMGVGRLANSTVADLITQYCQILRMDAETYHAYSTLDLSCVAW